MSVMLLAVFRSSPFIPAIVEYLPLLPGGIFVCCISGLSEDRSGVVSEILEDFDPNQERRRLLDLVHMFERVLIPGNKV